jgi:hypothetical protein
VETNGRDVTSVRAVCCQRIRCWTCNVKQSNVWVADSSQIFLVGSHAKCIDLAAWILQRAVASSSRGIPVANCVVVTGSAEDDAGLLGLLVSIISRHFMGLGGRIMRVLNKFCFESTFFILIDE